MPSRDLDCVFYVREAPTIEYRDGNFHVCYDISRSWRFEIVLSRGAFNKAMLLATEAVAQSRLDEAPADNVTPFRRAP